VGGRFATAKEAERAIFYDHYDHFGLSAKYSKTHIPQLH